MPVLLQSSISCCLQFIDYGCCSFVAAIGLLDNRPKCVAANKIRTKIFVFLFLLHDIPSNLTQQVDGPGWY